MALNTAIRGLQIRDTFFGDGLKRNATDGDIAELDLKTGGGLKIDTAQLAVEPADFAGAGLVDDGNDNLAVNVDNVSLEISGNVVQIKDGGVSEAKLDINSAPTDGYVLYWNATAGKLDYKDVDINFIANDDVIVENLSAEIGQSGYTGQHTLNNTPVASSVQVYLNGLLQEEGSGKDYTLAGSVITFTTAPEFGDILIVHYIKA